MCLASLKNRNDLTPDEIDILLNDEKDIKTYRKLVYFKLKSLDHSVKEASNILGIKQSTAYKWEDKWNEGGYNELLHKSGAGRSSKLNSSQIKELGELLSAQDGWKVKEIQKLISDNFNVDYSYYGARTIVENHFPDIKIIMRRDETKTEDIGTNEIMYELDEIDDDLIDLNLIIDYFSSENDKKVLKKLHYLELRALNYSNNSASYLSGVSSSTGYSWWKQWRDSGLKGLMRKEGSGRPSKLTEEEWAEFEEIFKTRDDWQTTELLSIINKKFKVKYSPSHLGRILKERFGAKHWVPHIKDY